MTLRKIIIKAYIVIALLMSILVAGIYFLSQQQIERQNQQNVLSMIETIAGSISNETLGLTQWVEAVANDETIINTFKAGEQQRQAKAQELEGQMAGLLRLRLLPPGVNQPDELQRPHLGYADLELIQTAKSENPQPVIIQMKLPDAHIAIARAVYENEQLVGTVLASFATDRIKQFLQTLSQQHGEIALFQDNQSLSTTTDPAFMESEPSGRLAINATPWDIRYWTTEKGFGDMLYSLAALLTALFVLGVFCSWLLRNLNAQFANDVIEMKKLVTNTVKGIKETNYEMNFSMFADLIKHARMLNIRDVTDGKTSIEVSITSEEEEERNLVERSAELLDDLDKQFTQADNLIDNLDNEELDLGVKPAKKSSIQTAEMQVLPDSVVDFPDTLPLTTGLIEKDFNADYLRDLGRALGTELLQAEMTEIVVGVDNSKASNKAIQEITPGLLSTGCKLLKLRSNAGPVVAFSTQLSKDSLGIIVSNSFLPVTTCKLKFLYSGGYSSEELLKRVNSRLKSGDYTEGLGVSSASDATPETEYIGAVVEDIHIHCAMKVAIVSASNTISELAGTLLKALGCDVINIAEPSVASQDLFDPRNPSHLQQLSATVQSEQADLGLAYDTEGAGLSIVDSSGHVIWPDRVMMILAADLLQTFPGADILFDNDCLSALAKTVTQNSGKLLTHSSGENVFSKLTRKNMPLAGNMNGQFVFADRWLHYPDALYASARLLEILSTDDLSSQEVFSALPDYIGTQPFFSAIAQDDARVLLKKWENKLLKTQNTVVSNENGLRIESANIGWVVMRYDKNQGGLVFRFQAKSDEALEMLKKSLNKLVAKDSVFKLPF
jgi:phosphomannomutase/phosphoglucomutase